MEYSYVVCSVPARTRGRVRECRRGAFGTARFMARRPIRTTPTRSSNARTRASRASNSSSRSNSANARSIPGVLPLLPLTSDPRPPAPHLPPPFVNNIIYVCNVQIIYSVLYCTTGTSRLIRATSDARANSGSASTACGTTGRRPRTRSTSKSAQSDSRPERRCTGRAHCPLTKSTARPPAAIR